MTGRRMLDAIEPGLFRALAGVQKDLQSTENALRNLLRRVARNGETPEDFSRRLDLLSRARELAMLREKLLGDANLRPVGVEASGASAGATPARLRHQQGKHHELRTIE